MSEEQESTTTENPAPEAPAEGTPPPAPAEGTPSPDAAPAASDKPVSSIQDIEAKAASLGKPSEVKPGTPGAYTPNLTYKFDSQVKEIDPFFHSLIKDPESEKRVQLLLQRAESAQKYSEKISTYEKQIKEDLEPRAQKFDTIDSQLKQAGEMYRKGKETGDLDDFFDAIQVDSNAVLRYAAKKLAYMDLPEDQKRIYDENRQLRKQTHKSESQLSAINEKAQIEEIHTRSFQLDQSLTRPEVKHIVDAVNTSLGKPTAFREMVIEIGRLAFNDPTNPRDLTPDEAVKIALDRYAPFIKAQSQTAAPTSAPAKAPPVIKNLSGTASTPAKRVIKSLADIIARQKELSPDEQ